MNPSVMLRLRKPGAIRKPASNMRPPSGPKKTGLVLTALKPRSRASLASWLTSSGVRIAGRTEFLLEESRRNASGNCRNATSRPAAGHAPARRRASARECPAPSPLTFETRILDRRDGLVVEARQRPAVSWRGATR